MKIDTGYGRVVVRIRKIVTGQLVQKGFQKRVNEVTMRDDGDLFVIVGPGAEFLCDLDRPPGSQRPALEEAGPRSKTYALLLFSGTNWLPENPTWEIEIFEVAFHLSSS